MRVLSEGTGIHRYVCLARCFAAADPCSAVSSIECAFPDSQTLLHAGVRFTQLSSCTDKNASIFRHNPWVWMPAQMLLHVFISIISQGLDASSKAAPHLLHQTHRVWMPHRCCTLLKAARYASGCVGFVTRLTPTADLVMRFTPQLAAAAHCSKQRGTQAAASICNAVDSEPPIW